jgi:hypothetical protein
MPGEELRINLLQQKNIIYNRLAELIRQRMLYSTHGFVVYKFVQEPVKLLAQLPSLIPYT